MKHQPAAGRPQPMEVAPFESVGRGLKQDIAGLAGETYAGRPIRKRGAWIETAKRCAPSSCKHRSPHSKAWGVD